MRIIQSKLSLPLLTLLLTFTATACTGEKVSLDSAKTTVPAKEHANEAAKTEPKKEEASHSAVTSTAPVEAIPGVHTSKSYDGVAMGEAQHKKDSDYRLTGTVSAIRNSQIAFRTAGFVSEIKVKPGKAVKKGEVLGTLDDRDYVLRLALAKAHRDQAKVALEVAEKDYKREKQLKDDNASTETVFDKMRAAYNQADLSLKLAEIELATAQNALQDTRLAAPYDCVVASQMKHEGENVPVGTPVFEVYDTSAPEITLQVPERLMSTVAVGAEMTVTVPSAAYSGKAQIIRMVPVIMQKTRTFEITVKLQDANAKVVPGSYAEATLN